ncbi:MAG: D-aminoacyl-tRNA deacylase [Nitriliruptoraceae bacterium]
MRALLQRVHEAWVTSAPERDAPAEEVGRIGAGLLALVGVAHEDDDVAATRIADRIATLRVFPDAEGVPNVSCLDAGGAVLVVSQFTLYADTAKGRRPSYVAAAPPEHAEPLVERVAQRLGEHGVTVATGRFRTHMNVGLVNDGPMTILLEV